MRYAIILLAILFSSCKDYVIVVTAAPNEAPCPILCGKEYDVTCPTTYDEMCNERKDNRIGFSVPNE